MWKVLLIIALLPLGGCSSDGAKAEDTREGESGLKKKAGKAPPIVGTEAGPLGLFINTKRNKWQAWEDVTVYASLENRSDSPVVLYLGNGQTGDHQYVAFTLMLTSDKNKVYRIGFARHGWRKPHPIEITLQPGQRSAEIPLRMSESGMLQVAHKKPPLGKYNCTATFNTQKFGHSNPIHSNEISFEVTGG